MLNKNFAKPPKRKTVPEWMKEQEALNRVLFEDPNHPDFKEKIKMGHYPAYYDPELSTMDEKGGLMNKDGTKATYFTYTKPTQAPVVGEPKVAKPMPVEGRKALEIGPTNTFDPNTGKYYDSVTKEEVQPIVEGKAKGGKVRKYSLGGLAEAGQRAASAANGQGGVPAMGTKTQGVVGGLGGAAATIGTTAATAIDANNMANEQGQVNENKAALSGGLKYASTVAPIATNPALLAATGGLSALAIPVAGGIGAIVAARKAGENNDKAAQLYKEQQFKEGQDAQQLRADEAIRKRDLGYSQGGKIVGKGTGTSDGIAAKVKKGSFIVPAKNAEVAEEIREKVLRKAPSKKAALKQDGGVKVKLSNGEHLFTPKEVEKLEDVLGEDVLDKLAPEAMKEEDRLEGETSENEGMAKGGTVKLDPETKKEYEKLKQLKAKADSPTATAKDKALFKAQNDKVVELVNPMGSAQYRIDKKKAEIPSYSGAEIERKMGVNSSTSKRSVPQRTTLPEAAQVVNPMDAKIAAEGDTTQSELNDLSRYYSKPANTATDVALNTVSAEAAKTAADQTIAAPPPAGNPVNWQNGISEAFYGKGVRRLDKNGNQVIQMDVKIPIDKGDKSARQLYNSKVQPAKLSTPLEGPSNESSPKIIEQGGYTYTLNPETGKYE